MNSHQSEVTIDSNEFYMCAMCHRRMQLTTIFCWLKKSYFKNYANIKVLLKGILTL